VVYNLRNDLYCVEWGVKLYSLTHYKVVDQWRTQLLARVKAKAGHHFEHLLYTSADLRRDVTGFFRATYRFQR